MPVLYKQEVVRKPGGFSKPEIETLSFLSHNENQESKTILKWCELGKVSYQKMIDAMNKYLISKEAITSIEQFPADIKPSLQYAMENKDNFSLKTFLSKTNFRNLKNEIKITEDGCADSSSSIYNLMERCANTALAIHKTGNFINKSFDVKEAFKISNLLIDSFIVGKKEFNINATKYLERPFILNVPCIMELKPCLDKKPILKTGKDKPNNNEKDCPCNDLKEKEHSCNCEKTATDPCDCKCDNSCHDQNPCSAKIETFVAELFVVEDEVACYKPGDISYIENVMKGEKKVRKHRHLQREESYTETEEENNSYTERNTQIDERFSLHKEIDKVIETDLSVEAGANYSSKWGTAKGANRTFSASLDVSYNRSKKDARKIVQDQSKNIITNAIEKLEKKARSLNSKRMINEIDEKNKHSFDGKEFTEHDNGIYFFVNQERKAQVYSHGVREMLDFYIPDPSLRLKTLLEKEFELEKPKKPCINIEDIDPKDYLKYVQCYGFTDLEKPPKVLPDIIKSYRDVKGFKKNNWREGWTTQYNITIPNGYKGVEWKLEYSKNWPASGKRNVEFELGGSTLTDYSSGRDNQDVHGPKSLNNITGTSATINIKTNLRSFRAWITIKYTPIEQVDFLPWQIEVYNRIMENYNSELEKYNTAFEEFQRNKQNKFSQNPFMLSETIKEQLKHSALEYITCQFFDDKNGMRNKVKPCGLPQMDIPETEEFGKKVRFFEQAFEWKFMSYMLYPYFWADKCSWEDKLNEEAQNGLFQKFLQSGYARISLSIRPGFEPLVQYYLEEGKTWGGLGLPSIGNASYLPIHQEIKESKDNFNTNRNGYLLWDSTFTPTLNKDEIIIKEKGKNYYNIITDTDSSSPTFNQLILDPFDTAKDINRIVTIDCIEYRIVDILLVNGEIILKLDRDLEHKDSTLCPDDFNNRYKDKNILWSTGAKFEGAPWSFTVPTSLTWLKEEECLPCYPINCKENC
ncbi:hypothetical protein [uncultured Lacinutrix sp.]|uniref:hypothetical protein n=1 Tax=uncultured Lacinutrix sp. TaxID=574032 RepID=UPI00261F0EE1|nr:hypothetical protein [uncultured Lacinutrix sp.]